MTHAEALRDLARLRDDLATWRGQRSGRGRIQERFWLAAAALVAPLSVTRVCRKLALKSEPLRSRLPQRERPSEPPPTHLAPSFLEGRASDLLGESELDAAAISSPLLEGLEELGRASFWESAALVANFDENLLERRMNL